MNAVYWSAAKSLIAFTAVANSSVINWRQRTDVSERKISESAGKQSHNWWTDRGSQQWPSFFIRIRPPTSAASSSGKASRRLCARATRPHLHGSQNLQD